MGLMIADVSDAEAMALVRASPNAVRAQDKQAWLALWAQYHVVEDPVGSRPVLGGLYDRRTGRRGDDPLRRFWDTFIDGNDIDFDVHADFRAGERILRDVTIRTVLPTGVCATTPAHLLYELVAEGGELKIRRMAAHWAVWPVYVQLLRPTGAHLRAVNAMTGRMVRHLGIGSTLRFAGSVRSVGERGKSALRELVRAADAGDRNALALLGDVVPQRLTKVIASGDVVTASAQVGGRPAAVMATIDRRAGTVIRADVFTDTVLAAPLGGRR
jgi:SnoaL-like protein